jgi:hypothetical protein
MVKIFVCLCIAACSGTFSYAQQAISSSGGNGIGSGGTVSFASGQSSYTSIVSNSGTVNEGVLQPFEIHIVTRLDADKSITLECEAYPNPATDFLILKIHKDQIENMKYQLIDLNGKVLEEAFIGNEETTISLKHYKPTTYLLKVLDKSTEVMIFKITKTNQP